MQAERTIVVKITFYSLKRKAMASDKRRIGIQTEFVTMLE